MKKKKSNFGKWILFFVILYVIVRIVNSCSSDYDDNNNHQYDDKVFSIIASSENKMLYSTLKNYADKKKYNINISTNIFL